MAKNKKMEQAIHGSGVSINFTNSSININNIWAAKDSVNWASSKLKYVKVFGNTRITQEELEKHIKPSGKEDKQNDK